MIKVYRCAVNEGPSETQVDLSFTFPTGSELAIEDVATALDAVAAHTKSKQQQELDNAQAVLAKLSDEKLGLDTRDLPTKLAERQKAAGATAKAEAAEAAASGAERAVDVT